MMQRIARISNWWAHFSLFIICSIFFYAYAIYRLDLEKKPLIRKALSLEAKKRELIDEIDLFTEMTQSLFDPSADEYALIMRHGKIPEGAIKICIRPKKELDPL